MNIAEILKNYKKGIHLYSVIYGDVQFSSIDESIYPVVFSYKHSDVTFTSNVTEEGKVNYGTNGECTLFPSAKMRDWTKFYKRGDLIYDSETNSFAIFNKWANDGYTAFYVKYQQRNKGWSLDGIVSTMNTSLVKPDSESYNGYMKRFEEHYEGRLNPQTLQIEHLFKPYDMVLVRDKNDEVWEPDIFALYDGKAYLKYTCFRNSWRQCIPYDEARVGTTD